MATTTFEKADDYTLRKVELVERVEVTSYDALNDKLTYLQNAKVTNQLWYDRQIEDVILQIAEAGKLAIVSQKEAVELAREAEPVIEEPIEEEIVNP